MATAPARVATTPPAASGAPAAASIAERCSSPFFLGVGGPRTNGMVALWWRRLLTAVNGRSSTGRVCVPALHAPRRAVHGPSPRVPASPLAPRSAFSRSACEHAVHLPTLELPSSVDAAAKPTIAVAMSGGVDSSVTAWLLKEAGYNIFGIHMQNWDEEEEKGMHAEVSGHCSSAQDLLDARRTCDLLGVELKLVRFVREYWTDVFDPMLRDYMAGATPNPDIACNREIKFNSLLEQAHLLGAHILATGHYARLEYTHEAARLLEARDGTKDQSYFLSSVPGSAFKKVMFPLGVLLKEEVRAIASAANLPAASKRESMGLCFVGRRRFDHFLSNYLPDMQPSAIPASSSPASATEAAAACPSQMGGQFVCVETRRPLGPHKGLHLYTIGQGAKISGAAVRLSFVVCLLPACQRARACTRVWLSAEILSCAAVQSTSTRASFSRAIFSLYTCVCLPVCVSEREGEGEGESKRPLRARRTASV